jgi:RNA polymerase sigma-70 factor (ECF subfamily)
LTDSLIVANESQTASSDLINGRHNVDDELQWSQWMAAAQGGNADAYQRLLQALGRVIERFLRARFGALDFLEDCVQECLLALHQGRHTFDPQRPFRPWMFAIVRHKAIDMLRKRHVHTRHLSSFATDNDDEDPIHSVADKSNAVEDLLQSSQLFHGLSPSFRQALILTKVHGYSIREAAGHEGISEVAMKVRVHRAMQELKKDLELM